MKAKWEVILHTESDESKAVRRKQIIENTLILNEHKLNLKMWQKRLRSMKQFREDIQLSLNKSFSSHHYETLNHAVHHVQMGQRRNANDGSTNEARLPVKEACDDDTEVTLSDMQSSQSKITSCPDESTAESVPEEAVMSIAKVEYLARSFKDTRILDMLHVLKGHKANVLANGGVAKLNKNAVAWVLHEVCEQFLQFNIILII